MNPEFKLNNNLFGSLNVIINIPFMLIDNMGNVLSFNKEAGLLFHFELENNNVYDELDDPSREWLSGLIEKLFSSDLPTVQLANLRLKSGFEIRGEVQLNIYTEQLENYILFSLKKGELTAPSSLSEISM